MKKKNDLRASEILRINFIMLNLSARDLAEKKHNFYFSSD